MSKAALNLPEWISPPGSIVSRILVQRHVALDDFAAQVGLSSLKARGLIEGTLAIDETLAADLASVIGSTPSFWLRCEQTYRADVERNMHSYVNDDVLAWMARLPLAEMANLGWVKRYRNSIKQAEECFRFFGVIGLDDLKQRQAKILADVNFRTSETYSSAPSATAAWLRWCENHAEETVCNPWNPDAFERLLPDIKALTRNHHPARFVPRLKELCATSGVAAVIAPAPKGCTASGATRFIRGRKAMIALSFRYYSDDQFWFTFFHEAAHLVRHGDQELFLEEEGGALDDREREANRFAFNTLIPPAHQDRMRKLPPEYDAYIAFSRGLGIAPGIVVGQMQRLELLPYSWLAKLKRRFDWKLLYRERIIP